MFRRCVRLTLWLSLLATAIAALSRVWATRRAAPSSATAWDRRPDPPPAAAPPWVEPIDGAVPPTHPVKVKLSSGLYHLPGMIAYPRTRPDRCYADAESAESDGFTRAKR